jgi:hypothetical protein
MIDKLTELATKEYEGKPLGMEAKVLLYDYAEQELHRISIGTYWEEDDAHYDEEGNDISKPCVLIHVD